VEIATIKIENASHNRGGSAKVFPDEQGAQARMKYIQAIAVGFPMAVEYDYTSGPVLVRVGKILTPLGPELDATDVFGDTDGRRPA
jgi:hypothetical protein